MPDIQEYDLPTVTSVGDSDFVRVVVSASEQSSKITKANLFNGVGMQISYACITDQKTQNTAGGTATSGSWQTRTLNTEQADPDGIVSISSNQFTLGAGTYIISASAPAFSVNRNQARLRNITDSTTTITGMSVYASAAGTSLSQSLVVGLFTIAGTKAFEIQHQVETTRSTDGYGVAGNFGVEVYSTVQLWKLTA